MQTEEDGAIPVADEVEEAGIYLCSKSSGKSLESYNRIHHQRIHGLKSPLKLHQKATLLQDGVWAKGETAIQKILPQSGW